MSASSVYHGIIEKKIIFTSDKIEIFLMEKHKNFQWIEHSDHIKDHQA